MMVTKINATTYASAANLLIIILPPRKLYIIDFKSFVVFFHQKLLVALHLCFLKTTCESHSKPEDGVSEATSIGCVLFAVRLQLPVSATSDFYDEA